jgi:hypothetical protein
LAKNKGGGGSVHKAKPTYQHNIARSVRNKAKGKYVKQRARTEANKLRRAYRFIAMVQDSRRRKGKLPFDPSVVLQKWQQDD